MANLDLLTEGCSTEHTLWSNIAKTAEDIQKAEIRPYVLLALKELSGEVDDRLHNVASRERLACVRAVVRHMARVRSVRTTPAYRREDVATFLDGLRFSRECVEELTSLLCTEEAYSRIPSARLSSKHLQSAHCRVDISVCQVNTPQTSEQSERAVMRRDLRIVLALVMVDGSHRTFTMSLQRFHELRHAVATVLKQLLVLERRHCMRRD